MGTNSKPAEEWAAIDAIVGPALVSRGWVREVQALHPGCELRYQLRDRAIVTFFLIPDERGKVQRRWMASAGSVSLANDRRYKGEWWQWMSRDAYIALRELDPSLPMGLLALRVKRPRNNRKGSRAGWLRHGMKHPRCLCGELLTDAPRGAYGTMGRCVCSACGARLTLIDQTEPRWSLRVACEVEGCLDQVVSPDGRCAEHQEPPCS